MGVAAWVGLAIFVALKMLVFKPGVMSAAPGGFVLDDTTASMLWSLAAAGLAELATRFPQIREWLTKLKIGTPATGGLTPEQDARLTRIDVNTTPKAPTP